MSVYWNTEANGKLTLVGNWTDEAINAFTPVEEAWEMEGDEKYGIWECGELSESLCAKFSYSFGSYDFGTYNGEKYFWLSFSDALSALDEWTRSWIKNTPKCNGKPIHPLSEEQYDSLLNMMYDNNLSISIEYDEAYHQEKSLYKTCDVGRFSSDGKKLIYKTLSSMDKMKTWEEFNAGVLDDSVDFFASFVKDADEPKIREWVKNNVTPNNILEGFGEDFDEDDFDDFLGDICDICDICTDTPFGEDALKDFADEFSPETNLWDKLVERMKEEMDWFTEDEPKS